MTLTYPILPARLPAAVTTALVGHTAELVYKARNLAEEFPWAPGVGDVEVRCYASALRDMYQPALPITVSVVPTGLNAHGLFDPVALQAVIAPTHGNEAVYRRALGTAAHEITHVDQFFPPELRQFVPSIDCIHGQVARLMYRARKENVFAPLDARESAIQNELRTFTGKKLEATPPPHFDSLRDLASYAAEVLSDWQRRPQSSLTADERSAMQEALTALSTTCFPELRAAFVDRPLELGRCDSEDGIAALLLAHGMLALLDSPALRQHATAIYLRTLWTWREYVQDMRDGTKGDIREMEAHIVGGLVEHTKERARVWTVMRDSIVTLNLPPLLRSAAGIMQYFAGTSEESRLFLANYHAATRVTWSLPI